MPKSKDRSADAPGTSKSAPPEIPNAREKAFCLEYVKTRVIKTAMIAAGYSPITADKVGYQMLGKPRVLAEIARLEKLLEDATISSIRERKQTLTEIHRGRLHHFGTAGADGFIPNVGPENLNSAALAQIETRVEVDKAAEGDGSNCAFITKLKLESKTAAIDMLNKMEGVYAAAEPGGNGNGMTVVFNIAAAPAREKKAIDVPSETVESSRIKKTFALAIGAAKKTEP